MTISLRDCEFRLARKALRAAQNAARKGQVLTGDDLACVMTAALHLDAAAQRKDGPSHGGYQPHALPGDPGEPPNMGSAARKA